MARLIRMDNTGHTTLAEWTAADPASVEAAAAALRAELDKGYYAVVSTGEGHAEQVDALPVDAELVILRRPIPAGEHGGLCRLPTARRSLARAMTRRGCACTARVDATTSSRCCRWSRPASLLLLLTR